MEKWTLHLIYHPICSPSLPNMDEFFLPLPQSCAPPPHSHWTFFNLFSSDISHWRFFFFLHLCPRSRDTTVKVWHVPTATEQKNLGGHTGGVTCLSAPPLEYCRELGESTPPPTWVVSSWVTLVSWALVIIGAVYQRHPSEGWSRWTRSRVLRLSETLGLPSLELKQPLPLPHSLLCRYSEHETLSREKWSRNDVAQVNCRSPCSSVHFLSKGKSLLS